ncbi:Mn-dependent DtxR family transcriptional regulator [Dokdonella fugitiva]|uniref:Mn-dependent DtxR family transcriptional regulator n=1 Tax=Dokdonella fugitiva TaxID=328517 RepID=A0A839F487_9GAMM|nr:hypothetical protein [Dokdonella fugitiva]MBA8887870.1 Mn-dependent DtxR family transcriptional regulator [Dokdonella fugitiva]
MSDVIPADVRRLVLANAMTIPHIEAILLFRRESKTWTPAQMAPRLYVEEDRACKILSDLETLGVIDREEAEGVYRYRPRPEDFARLLDRLELAYSQHLVPMTRLVHAAHDRTAEQFAKAFRIRKDP